MTIEEALKKYKHLAEYAAYRFIQAYPRLWPLDKEDLTQLGLITIWQTVEEVPDFTKGLLSYRIFNKLASRYLRWRRNEQPAISLTLELNDFQYSIPAPEQDPERLAIANQELAPFLDRPDLPRKIALLTALGYKEKELETMLPVKNRQIRRYKQRFREEHSCA